MALTRSTPEELRSLALETQALQEKTPHETVKIAENLETLRRLRTQIEQAGELGEITNWANKSQGVIPLASNRVMLESMTAAGGQQMAFEGRVGTAALRNGGAGPSGNVTGVQVLDQYGEGIYSSEALANTATDDYRGSFKSYMRKGINGCKASELKTLQESSDPSGGFLVPHDLLERVIAKEPTPTRVAGRVTRLQTSRDSLIIPRVNYTTDDNYTTGMRVTWTGEIPAASTTARVTDPVFGQTHVPIYTAMMSIPITNDMIEDAAFPLVSYVTGKFAETIDLLFDNIVLNGSGQGQPSGLLLNPGDTALTQPAIVAGTGGSGVIANDDVIDIPFNLPEQYDDNAAWVMNKTSTLRAVAKLKDGNNRYLFSQGTMDSGYQGPNWRNRELLGYPILLSGFMPNTAASAFNIIFGDLSGYYLVNRIGFSIQVLRELYAETNQILLLGRIRFGGQVTEPWKLKVYQTHA